MNQSKKFYFKDKFAAFSTPDMLHGPIFQSLIIFAIPVFFSTLLQNLYNTVDALIVGHVLGETALAAVGAGGVLVELLVGFANGAGLGMSMVLAQRYGAEDEEGMKRASAASLAIGLVLSLTVSCFGLLFLRQILIALNTPDEILAETYNYTRVIIANILACFLYNLFCNMLKALGNSLIPLLYLLLSTFMNVVLDLVFVAGLNRGVQGSAEATVIAQAFSALLCGIYILKKAPVLIPEKKHFRNSIKLYANIAWAGISMGLMNAIVTIGTLILQYAINTLGTLTIVAHTAARKIYSFGTMPISALASAISMFISQNFGAGQYDRMRRAMRDCFIFDVIYALAVTFLFWQIAKPAMYLMTGSESQYVIEAGARYVRFVPPFYMVLGALIQSRFALQGLGQKILPMISSVIELVGKVIFTIMLVPRFGYSAVIVCEPIIWCFMTAQLLISLYTQPEMRKNAGVKSV